MDGYGAGSWSGGAQLFCGAEQGAAVTLALPVESSGTYRLLLYATLAPDFGVVQCSLDGKPCGPPTDLFAPIVPPTGALEIGRVAHSAGIHRLRFEAVGKHSDSSGYHFGLDVIELAE
jgi:hypothetical protein